jgi:hypothetical protein
VSFNRIADLRLKRSRPCEDDCPGEWWIADCTCGACVERPPREVAALARGYDKLSTMLAWKYGKAGPGAMESVDVDGPVINIGTCAPLPDAGPPVALHEDDLW